jgi:hypothetical protein
MKVQVIPEKLTTHVRNTSFSSYTNTEDFSAKNNQLLLDYEAYGYSLGHAVPLRPISRL